MKTYNRVSVFVFVTLFMLTLSQPTPALAATTPSLGAAASFGVLARTYTNTTIANGATIFGDLGYTLFSGVAAFVSGATHINDAAYIQAGADQHTALSALNSQACTFTFAGAVDLAADTSHGALGVYAPGVYCSPGNMSIGGGGTIELSGPGTFIFRPSGTLTTSDFSIATTTNGASACDVFWTPQVPPVLAHTVLGSDTRFVGTVIEPVGPANSDITVGGGTRWVGRALAFDWTVTTNPVIMKYVTITVPTCTVPPPPPPPPPSTPPTIIVDVLSPVVTPPVEPPAVVPPVEPPVVIPPVVVPPVVVPPVVVPPTIVSLTDLPETGVGFMDELLRNLIPLGIPSAFFAALFTMYVFREREYR